MLENDEWEVIRQAHWFGIDDGESLEPINFSVLAKDLGFSSWESIPESLQIKITNAWISGYDKSKNKEYL